MGSLIVCDGGCGAVSPNPQTRLHEANNWLTVRAGYERGLDRLTDDHDKRFCKACAPRVLSALEPADGESPVAAKPLRQTAAALQQRPHRSIVACLFAAFLALFVAKALGVPFWRDGWSLTVIGDQVDFMLTAALLAWFIQPGGRRHGR